MRLCVWLILAAVAVGGVVGQSRSAEPPPELSAMKYRLVGPYAGGRVSRVAGVPGDPLVYYAATASGGVWKSTDGGMNWKPIFDDQPTSSIGSIAVAPSDPNIVYVGSGEANIRGNVAPGAGIFRSTDAGKTWSHVWKQVGQIGTMIVHPQNPDIAFAAVLGHAFGPNPERGIYRTTDGGKTWNKVLYVNEETGASDVCLDPSNPRILYAGMWQTRRRPWEHTSGGPGSDLFISRDGGDTWVSVKPKAADAAAEKKSNGLPPGVWGKVGIAVAPKNGQRVYALIEAEKGGMFRSDDGGETWNQTTDNRILRQRAWYYQTITPHPTNPDVVYCPNVPLLKTSDGGKTFAAVRGCHHGDHHDVWIDPTNPDRMIDANDGGVDISTDGGKTWYAPPLPITQFYHVSADNRTPYRIMGCMQDLGSASGPSRSLHSGGISLSDWQSIGGGEAGHAVADPTDPNIVYAGEYGGIMTRYDFRTNQARNITVNQWNPSGIDPAKHPYRFQWTAPILVSPHDPKTVYHAGNVLFRTRDAGQTWDAVSPDLTRNDKQKQQWSGGPITGDNTGAETYCTIFALAESAKQKGLLWAGSDDGRVHVSIDDAKTWTDLTPNIPDLPDWGTVKCIEPSPFDAGTAYLVVDNHRMDDYRPHLWKTTDTGKTWTKLSVGLEPQLHLHAVREDPKKKDLLYLGTEHGVMVSADGGATWTSLQLNLPTVPVHDLVVKNDDLVVGTHGRSFWILDDLTPLREKSATVLEKPMHLFSVKPTINWNLGSGNFGGSRVSSTPNPASGVVVWYHLAKKPSGDLTLEILNAAGAVVAKAVGKADAKDDDDKDEAEDGDAANKKERTTTAKAGLNRFVWDTTADGADIIPGAKVDAGNPGMGIPLLPGKFSVKLTIGKDSQTLPVELLPDPRVDVKTITPEQEQLALKVSAEITQNTRTVGRIRAILKQLALRKELLKDQPTAKALLTDSEALGKKFSEIEEKLHNPKAKVVYDIFAARGGAMLYSQQTWLLSNVTDAVGVPTKSQKEQAEKLTATLKTTLAEFDALVAGDLAKLNAAAKALAVPELYVPPAK